MSACCTRQSRMNFNDMTFTLLMSECGGSLAVINKLLRQRKSHIIVNKWCLNEYSTTEQAK